MHADKSARTVHAAAAVSIAGSAGGRGRYILVAAHGQHEEVAQLLVRDIRPRRHRRLEQLVHTRKGRGRQLRLLRLAERLHRWRPPQLLAPPEAIRRRALCVILYDGCPERGDTTSVRRALAWGTPWVTATVHEHARVQRSCVTVRAFTRD